MPDEVPNEALPAPGVDPVALMLASNIRYRRHLNGGGLVDERASVDAEVYVGPGASVTGAATLRGPVGLYDTASIDGVVVIAGPVTMRQHARVSGRARIVGRVMLTNHAHVTDDADIDGVFVIDFFAVVGGTSRLRGNYSVSG